MKAFEKIFGDVKSIDELLPTTKEFQIANKVKEKMEVVLGGILSAPNLEIQKLGELLAEASNNQMVAYLISNRHLLSCMLDYSDGSNDIAVVVPADFFDDISPVQMGIMIGVASQIKDFYNEQWQEEDEVIMRAEAAEAEFYKEIQDFVEFGECQEHAEVLLEKYPEGLNSLRIGLWYDSKPFVPGKKSSLYHPPSYKNN